MSMDTRLIDILDRFVVCFEKWVNLQVRIQDSYDTETVSIPADDYAEYKKERDKLK